jgi:hypothetical protein
MGFNLWESDDPLAAAKEGLLWTDLIALKVYPVVDDATIAKALTKQPLPFAHVTEWPRPRAGVLFCDPRMAAACRWFDSVPGNRITTTTGHTDHLVA